MSTSRGLFDQPGYWVQNDMGGQTFHPAQAHTFDPSLFAIRERRETPAPKTQPHMQEAPLQKLTFEVATAGMECISDRHMNALILYVATAEVETTVQVDVVDFLRAYKDYRMWVEAANPPVPDPRNLTPSKVFRKFLIMAEDGQSFIKWELKNTERGGHKFMITS